MIDYQIITNSKSDLILSKLLKMTQSPQEHLLELAYTKMPFGKYKGYFLSDIPEPYYVWMRQGGFAQNKIGQQLAEVYELKVNGLEVLLKEIRKKYPQK